MVEFWKIFMLCRGDVSGKGWWIISTGKIVVVASLSFIQGGSNMTGTDLYVNKPHCAAAV